MKTWRPLTHNWTFDLELSNASATGKQCYRCSHCKQWTDDTGDVSLCPKMERRKLSRRRWQDRRNVKRDETVQIQASALMDIPVTVLDMQRAEDFGKNGDATTPGFFKGSYATRAS